MGHLAPSITTKQPKKYVPRTGIEPVLPYWQWDFKSHGSTNSPTEAVRVTTRLILYEESSSNPYYEIFKYIALLPILTQNVLQAK